MGGVTSEKYVRKGGGPKKKYACVQGGRGSLIFDILVRTYYVNDPFPNIIFFNVQAYELGSSDLNNYRNTNAFNQIGLDVILATEYMKVVDNTPHIVWLSI